MILSNFPYFSQLDNRYNPSGACNVTSVAMCLHYLGIRGDGSERQLEDQLYRRCEEKGWSRHDPLGLQLLIESYNRVDHFTNRSTFADIYRALDANHPVILHGYFTRSGHIIAVKGYDERGLIVNDPYGEYFSWGYNTSLSGEAVHYSNDLIARVCSPESPSRPNHIWMHELCLP